jgi:WD40 repeat protein
VSRLLTNAFSASYFRRSPNNDQQKMLATSSMDNTVVLWDLESGTEKVQVRTKDTPLCLDWDPNKPDMLLIATKNGASSCPPSTSLSPGLASCAALMP